LHVLHAVYGECTEGQPVATYRVVYADGTVQQANIQNSREIADWWMPYGHRFGGGGTLRIDPACCRLAYVSGCDQFQGHGLYLYWRALERRSTEVAHVEFVGSAERASVIVAAVTVEQ